MAAGSPALSHLPPHLREVCAILATGLLRLRRRDAEGPAHDAVRPRVLGESSLHFPAGRSGPAAPNRRTA